MPNGFVNWCRHEYSRTFMIMKMQTEIETSIRFEIPILKFQSQRSLNCDGLGRGPINGSDANATEAHLIIAGCGGWIIPNVFHRRRSHSLAKVVLDHPAGVAFFGDLSFLQPNHSFA